jgi:hypothetical protein
MLPGHAYAWGKRGHQIVGEVAAMTVSGEERAGFMKSRAFDFGYYANVPDFIWKRPESYQQEKNQHFMDLEHFERGIPADAGADALKLSRKEFDAKFPAIKEESGRAFWRVDELVKQLEGYTKTLREMKDDTPSKDRQAVQEKWLVTAGVLGHYIGDLGQPLHVTENYDGQMTGQKGVHSHFEDDLVDELYPDLLVAVNKKVKAEWPAFKKKNGEKSLLELLQRLTKNSHADLKTLLALDKKLGRSVSVKNASAYRKMFEERMADSALTLAEIYRRNLGWKFDGNRFYFFAGEPKFIPPGEQGSSEAKK